MKKFVYGILTTLMLFGGVFLSACEPAQISLSLSTNIVNLVTNDETGGSPREETISVSLTNSDLGVGVEIISGEEHILPSDIVQNRKGNFNFTITAQNSGEALIRVYSLEDNNIFEYINVSVKTNLGSLQMNDMVNANGQSEMWIERGGYKVLYPETYFTFDPIDADVDDLVWTFNDIENATDTTNAETSIVADDQVVAEIVDNTLYVYDNYTSPIINVYASWQVGSTIISADEALTFSIVNPSSIQSLTMNGTAIDLTGTQSATTISLVKNNFNTEDQGLLSEVSGIMVVESSYDMDLSLRAFQFVNGRKVYIEEYQNYFKLDDIVKDDNIENQLTFEFTIDALDDTNSNYYGDLYVEFVLSYKDFTYEIDTSNASRVLISTYFVPETVVIRNETENIGGATIDLYSYYFSSRGYRLTVNLEPSDVGLNDNTYHIEIDLGTSNNSPEDYLQVYTSSSQDPLAFSQIEGFNTYTTGAIASGTTLYLRSGTLSTYSNFEIRFVANGNPRFASESIYANGYRIVDDVTMNVQNSDGTNFDFDSTYFISSSSSSEREITFNLRVYGMSSSTGLSPSYTQNRNFSITMVDAGNSYEDVVNPENSYVDVNVTVSLNGRNIQDSFEFTLLHQTGMESEVFKIEAFNPLTSATVSNGDRGAVNVYFEDVENQDYIIDQNANTWTSSNGEYATSDTLSSVMISAGSNFPLSFNFNSATLSADAELLVFDFEAYREQNPNVDEEVLYEDYYASLTSEDLLEYSASFDADYSEYFTYANGQIRTQNSDFIVYVAVIFHGFNENHENLSLVRLFRLESFYPVTALRSDVTDAELYARESLGEEDEDLSNIDVQISMRLDREIPTYSDMEYFSIAFASNSTTGAPNYISITDENNAVKSIIQNENGSLRLTAFNINSNRLTFNIQAESTLFSSELSETIYIRYSYRPNENSQTSYERTATINLRIIQANRVENVTWVNETYNSEVYLNLISNDVEDKTFTISTSVSPNEANNRSLTYYYYSLDERGSNLSIETTAMSQSFTLTIGDQSEGGYGYLYILPEDMVKRQGGSRQIVYYNLNADGTLSTTAEYLPLSEIYSWYDDVVNATGETGELYRADYFLNNAGERVFYRDLILRIRVTIADGKSEETAIRVYTQEDLENLDTSLYYRVMNDITLDNWMPYAEFSGMIFGDNEDITLNFTNVSQTFINTLTGVVKDLIFTGEVTGGGFVANTISQTGAIESTGVVSNVKVDVRYVDGRYAPSVVYDGVNVAGSYYLGAIAGQNNGLIENSYALGVELSGDNNTNTFVGGIAGRLSGEINGCGVEFYKFDDGQGGVVSNQFLGRYFGGIAGASTTENGSVPRIVNSYAYAFSLEEYDGATITNATSADVFVGNTFNETEVENTFAYLGDIEIRSTNSWTFRNSYNTYISDVVEGNATLSFRYFDSDGDGEVITLDEISSADFSSLNSQIWEYENIDSSRNFGFPHLKHISQTPRVSVEQSIYDVDGKVLSAENDRAVFFFYDVTTTPQNDGASYELDMFNTISIIDLFNLEEEFADSMLVSVDREQYLSFSTTNLFVERTTLDLSSKIVTLNLFSRMDFSVSKQFEIMIVYAVPEMSLATGGSTLNAGQILSVQTGRNNSRTVETIVDSNLYLNGTRYTLLQHDYYYTNTLTNNQTESGENYFSSNVAGNTVNYTANLATGGNYVNSSISMGITSIDTPELADFNNTVVNYNTTSILLGSYNGANALFIDAISSDILPSESTSFNAVLNTDNSEDDLVLTFVYNDLEYDVVMESEAKGYVQIGDNLKLDVNIAKTSESDNEMRFNVIINVNKDYRYKVDGDYALTVLVNPLSSNNYTCSFNLTVHKQEINAVNMTAYTISSRVIYNSVWYYSPSDTLSSTLVPGTDSILTMEVSPSFAHYSYFTLNYEISTSGNVGTVSLARLSYVPSFGYRINNTTSESIGSGLRITPNESDYSNGIYYFRIYISSGFSANSTLRLVVNFYDENGVIGTSYVYNYMIDYLNEANVLVDGATTVMLAKGDTAEISVTVDLDQTLTNLSLVGTGNDITRSDLVETVTETSRVYTATLRTSVLSTVSSGATGAFRVQATVQRTISGETEIKQSYATVYLVDFTINADETHIAGTSSTATYNGREYDVLHGYVNATNALDFNYSISPEEYSYDVNNIEEAEAVLELEEKRAEFNANDSYADTATGYYINYQQTANGYEEVALRERLYIVSSTGVATHIYNTERDRYVENTIVEFSGSGGNVSVRGLRTGQLLMRLETYIVVNNTSFTYTYDFLINIEVWTDEEVPLPIYTAEQFVDYLSGNENGTSTADDYILMNDIVLTDYTPLSTQYFDSFDGNGYTIFINSFHFGSASTTLNLALFSEVTANSTIKNVRVNLYNGGKITVNLNVYNEVNIAGFALVNNGIIYNSDVVAYYDSNLSSSQIVSSATGLVVDFVRGAGTDPINITSTNMSNDNVNISGFVGTNAGVITNSRVGGETYSVIIERNGSTFYNETTLPLFTLQGQGNVAGFVGENSGTVSSSFAKNIEIKNQMNSTSSETAGFVLNNSGEVHTSFIQGQNDSTTSDDFYFDGSSIVSTGRVGGFVYVNSGLVKNSYVNIAFEIDASRSYLSAGFVYENSSNGKITLCYSATKMSNSNINEMSFSGVNERGEDLNQNPTGITYSYYYVPENVGSTTQDSYTTGATSITDVDVEDAFYRFSFASEEGALDGIWTMTEDGITLTSANHIAFSNRYLVQSETSEEYSLFYSTLTDYSTRRLVDLSYGSLKNPIIIRDASDFALATGRAQEKEISSYKQYYTDTEVFGHYRIVSNIDFDDIDQNLEGAEELRLTTTTKTFSGILDGNAFTISNINLGSSSYVENYGLFARLNDASIMNLGLEVASVHNVNANIVGTLAGTMIDSRLSGIELSPIPPTSEEEEVVSISIAGNNIVGGVVGIVLGNSKLSDIQVTDIDVASAYYDGSKEVGYNDRFTGTNIRQITTIGGSLMDAVDELSYAGAVSGYVDMFMSVNEESVEYSTTVVIPDFQVATIRVLSSVDIYGEVAGGIFGYLGSSTQAFDMGLELDANMNLTNPSYITSKNLYAGGLVGESYGGLYAVYTEHIRTMQDTIEESMYSYYNGSQDVERGQMSIFSYTQNDTLHYNTRYNNPYYVGGLVGYAGGGYISVAYNRLNVVSNTTTREESYFGGIIGYLNASTTYNTNSITDNSEVTYYLHEVYFSGVLNSNTSALAGGIVGQISSSSVLAMEFVNSIPYYEQNSNRDNIFALVAGFEHDDLGMEVLPSHLYLLDNYSGYYDVITKVRVAGRDAAVTTVSAVVEYLYEDDTLTDEQSRMNYINGFRDNLIVYNGTGVDSVDSSDVDFSYEYAQIIQSPSHLSTMAMAYTRMSNFFIRAGWNDSVWTHELETMFPRIEFVPELTVIYLDYDIDSVREVLEAIHFNSSLTVVVRGRIDRDDPDAGHADVDLRRFDGPDGEEDTVGEILTPTLINNFSGRIISYRAFINEGTGDATEGIVNRNINGDIGGEQGDDVGIIIDSALFENAISGFEITDLNIYYHESESDTTTSHSILIENTANGAILNNLNIYVRSDLSIEADSYGRAGILVPYAISSDFTGVHFTLNEGVSINFASFDTSDGSTPQTNQYFGVLAGVIRQESPYRAMAVGNIRFDRVGGTDGSPSPTPIAINFENKTSDDYSYNIYFGLLTGQWEIDSYAADATFRINNLTNTTLNITLGYTPDGIASVDANINDIYFGGYIGRADITSIETEANKDPNEILSNTINVTQNFSVANNEYFGLVVGELEGNGGVRFTSSSIPGTDNTLEINGSLNLGDSAIGNDAYIGGFIGHAEFNTVITCQLSVNFSINAGGLTNYFSNPTEEPETPLLVTNNAYIGSFIGYLSGGSLRLGGFDISGNINVKINAGVATGDLNQLIRYGIVGEVFNANLTIDPGSNGHSISSVNVVANSNIENNGSDEQLYVGGLAGIVSGTSEIDVNRFLYTGTTVAFSETLKFGGLFGQIGRALETTIADTTITNSGYGGKVEFMDVKSQETDEEGNPIRYDYAYNLTTGGIIGTINASGVTDHFDIEIEGARTYGDVYVNYLDDSAKLTTFYYGGIIGEYQAPAQEVENIGNVSLNACYTLMTPFNFRLTKSYDLSSYQVNALVGHGSESISSYTSNLYSSSVNFSYQDISGENNGGSIDVGYYNQNVGGETITNDAYRGYGATASDSSYSYENIVDAMHDFANSFGLTLTTNSKLNPKQVVATVEEVEDAESEVAFEDIAGETDAVSWYYLADDLDLTSATDFAGIDINNVVLVGNGNRIHTNTAPINTMATDENSFTVVTSLTVDMDMSKTTIAGETIGGLINTLGNPEAVNSTATALLYGVGVEGEMYIGGNQSDVMVGGIVGDMSIGIMENAYFDADIFFGSYSGSGSDYSTISGVANTNSANVLIRNTFSGGSVQAYVPVNIALFNYHITPQGVEDTAEIRIYDSYSYMNILRYDYGHGVDGKASAFAVNESERIYYDSSADNMALYYSGDYSSDISGDGTHAETGELSVGWNKNGSISDVNSILVNGSDQSLAKWNHSRYFNNGYATTNFGYLRNVSVYSYNTGTAEYTKLSFDGAYRLDYASRQDDTTGGEDDETGTTLPTDYYFAVQSHAKFGQAMDAINNTEESEGNSEIYEDDTQFFLKYDIDLNKIPADSGYSRGQDLGTEGRPITIDGQGNNFTSTDGNTAMFDEIRGTLRNLNIVVNGEINETADKPSEAGVDDGGVPIYGNYLATYGALANRLYGTLENVTVKGNIEVGDNSERNIIGGVVGYAEESNLTNVQSLVNITTSENNNVIGGVVGFALKTSISNSINAGNIISENSLSNIIGITATTYNDNGGNDADQNVENNNFNMHNIIGGVVGFAFNYENEEDVVVKLSYNTGSIINNYKNTTMGNKYNLSSGGIVGYSERVDISQSLNAGYVQAGNYDNTGVALAGGIVGYTTASITNCINDARVHAISDLKPSYEVSNATITLDVPGLDKDGKPDRTDSAGDATATVSYNITYNSENPNRLVFAYALGYVNNTNNARATASGVNIQNGTDGGVDVSNDLVESTGIINDGNIGQITVNYNKKFTLPRYANGSDDFWIGAQGYQENKGDRYGLSDSYSFSQTPDVSAYDAYGFPSRFNLSYTYTFNFEIFDLFKLNTVFQNGNDLLNITIKDDYTTEGHTIDLADYYNNAEILNNISLFYLGLRNLGIITDEQMYYTGFYYEGEWCPGLYELVQNCYEKISAPTYPGGTTEYYLSLNMYAYDTSCYGGGISYENYVMQLNDSMNNLSNVNVTEITETPSELYNKITKVETTTKDNEEINIAGEDYTIAYDDNNLTGNLILKTNVNSLTDGTIYGNDHTLSRFITTTDGSGASVSISNWKNVNIVTSASLEDILYNGGSTYYFIEIETSSDDVNYKDIALYGSLRNINALDEQTRNTKSIRLDAQTGDGSSGITDEITSYMSMIGMDASHNANTSNSENGLSVMVTLYTRGDNNYGIVVSGNGANGSNGSDGAIVHNNTFGRGGNGGTGGTIDIPTSSNITSIYGYNGVGGNGGNGSNGTNAEVTEYGSTGVTIQGNRGGYAGGGYGTATANENTKSNLRKSRALAGSGGTGGLGLVYYHKYINNEIDRSDVGGGDYYQVENAIRQSLSNIGFDAGYRYYQGFANGVDNVIGDGKGGLEDYYQRHFYITAAGGGSAGGFKANGNRGSKGDTFRGYDAIYRGSVWWPGTGEVITYGSYGYLWIDDHGGYSNEVLWGGLQLIPALSFNKIGGETYGGTDIPEGDYYIEDEDGLATAIKNFINDYRWGLLGTSIYYYDNLSIGRYEWAVSSNTSEHIEYITEDEEIRVRFKLNVVTGMSSASFYMQQYEDSTNNILVDRDGNYIDINGNPSENPIILNYSDSSSSEYSLYEYTNSGNIAYQDGKDPFNRSENTINTGYMNEKVYNGKTLWGYIFVGGTGGPALTNVENAGEAGGTPYLQQIYGTNNAFNDDGNNYWYTRDDMVTSAGKYGNASELGTYAGSGNFIQNYA